MRRRHTSRAFAVLVLGTLGSGIGSGCSTRSDAEGPIPSGLITGPGTPPTSVAPDEPAATAAIATDTTGATGATDTSTTTPSTARLAVVPTDAATFAAALSSAELTIRDPASPPEAVEEAGRQYQLLLRALADVPELDEPVLAALDPTVRPTVERTVRARQFLQARNAADTTPSTPPSELPAWTIVPPEAPDVLLAHYREAEQLTGIAWYWLAAIHLQETRMGRIQGVSSAGAVGPMQFLPSTWIECCSGDPTVARDAIIGAATYLARSGGPTDMQAALHQYNPHDGYVAVVTAYAENLRDVPQLYAGYHAFQVFVGTSAGTVRLPVGYTSPTPVDAAAHLAAHPADAA
ncbi:MAG: lytic transglycosylase domain-containing protein [Acidimicrobiales bacterium]|nr:lytic transglycosylase domain-containing protein [Acidimicrobiales bacterium]MCB9395766.1 lytic transglycosylase domain-containing protein [Acidimicrobiaceae bacterium]